MTYDTLVTLQLRPHIAQMLRATVARIQSKIPNKKITEARILRHLLNSAIWTPEARAYAIGERTDASGEVRNLIKIKPGMSPYVQVRVRMKPEEHAALKRLALDMSESSLQYTVSTSRAVSALIVQAQTEFPTSDPDWELLDAMKTRHIQPTTETESKP